MNKLYSIQGGKPQLTRSGRKTLLRLRKSLKKAGIFLFAASFSKIPKAKLGFNLNEQDGIFLFNSQAIHAALVADTGGFFSPAFAQLAALDTAIGVFELAVGDVRNGVRGAEAAKITAKENVMKLLRKALRYINNLCEDNVLNAKEIITSAKMFVIEAGAKRKPDLSAKSTTDDAGTVKLAALAVKVDSKYIPTIYDWQQSNDGGATWINLPGTRQARTTVTGLTLNVKVLFRKRTNNKFGISDWSTPVEIYPR